MVLDVTKLDAFDVVWCGTLLTGFTFAFRADKKGESRVWQLAESIFLGLYGLGAYCCPSQLLDHVTVGDLDPQHTYLFQGLGIMLLSLAVVSNCQYQTSSKDHKVSEGWLLSRVVGFAFFLVNGVYGKLAMANDKVRPGDQGAIVFGMGFLPIWIGSLIKLWQYHSSENGSEPSKGKSERVLNQHLLVGVLLMVPMFVVFFGMPSFVMEVFTDCEHEDLHLHLIRAMGALGLTYILQEMTGLQYDRDEDKRNFFFGHIAGMAALFPMLIVNEIKHTLDSNVPLYCALVPAMLQLGNSVYGALICGKDKKH